MQPRRVYRTDLLKAALATGALSAARTFIDEASFIDPRGAAMFPVFLYANKLRLLDDESTVKQAAAVTVVAAGLSYLLLGMAKAVSVAQYAGAALVAYHLSDQIIVEYFDTSTLEKFK